ncbi:hypothetical protein [Xenorhabdus santafensis]|nr:hypothetical protein [Xenorhabdus sp. 12]
MPTQNWPPERTVSSENFPTKAATKQLADLMDWEMPKKVELTALKMAEPD